MRTFILCVERYIHFPPEIYRIFAKYLYYKQYWPDINIKNYNKVMKQLPYPIQAAAPRIIYQSDIYGISCGPSHVQEQKSRTCGPGSYQDEEGIKKPWRCCKLRYNIPYLLGGLKQRFVITEYLPFCQCRYVNGVNASDFTVLFNTEVSTGTWELEFDPNGDDIEWMAPEQRVNCWLTKVKARLEQEYQERVEYFKNYSVKQIKYMR